MSTGQSTFDPFAAPAPSGRPDEQTARPVSNGTTPVPGARPDGQTTRPGSSGTTARPQPEPLAAPASKAPVERAEAAVQALASKTPAEGPKTETLAAANQTQPGDKMDIKPGAETATVPARDTSAAARPSTPDIPGVSTERVLVVVRAGKVLVTTDPRVLLVDLDQIDASVGTDEIVKTLKGLKDTPENAGRRSRITDELMVTFRSRLGL